MSGAVDDLARQTPTRGSSRRRYVPYLLFALCSTPYLFPFMRVLLQGTDEGTLVYGAVRIVHGQVFARDFFEVIGPGTFYWLAAFFKLFGVTFIATRICVFISSLGTGLLMYFLSRRVCRTHGTLPCLVLAVTYFGLLWPGISHHADSNFFALASFACVVVWQDTRRRSLLIAAGALAGVTTCIHQPKGMLLLLSLLLWLYMQRRCSALISSLGLLMGGYFCIVGAVLLYFWSHGALRDLIYANFVWPASNYGSVNSVPYAQGLISHYWNNWVSGFWIVAAALLIVPFLFIAALPGILLILGAWHRRITAKPELVLYWLCGWALWFSEIHRKDIFHLVFGSPLLIILCVFYLEQFRTKISELSLQILTICVTSLAAFNLFLVLSAQPTGTKVGSVAIFKIDPILEVLQQKAAPGEEIFAYPYCPMYYFLSGTANPTHYSFLMYNYNTLSQFEEVVRVLEQRQVRYVVWNKGFQEVAIASFFPGARHIGTDALIIEPYLESHYRLVWADAETSLMERLVVSERSPAVRTIERTARDLPHVTPGAVR